MSTAISSYLPYPQDFRPRPLMGLGDPVLTMEGLGARGTPDDVAYVRFRDRTHPPPYGDEGGYVIRSLGQARRSHMPTLVQAEPALPAVYGPTSFGITRPAGKAGGRPPVGPPPPKPVRPTVLVQAEPGLPGIYEPSAPSFGNGQRRGRLRRSSSGLGALDPAMEKWLYAGVGAGVGALLCALLVRSK